jgi:hypothetical protein
MRATHLRITELLFFFLRIASHRIAQHDAQACDDAISIPWRLDHLVVRGVADGARWIRESGLEDEGYSFHKFSEFDLSGGVVAIGVCC